MAMLGSLIWQGTEGGLYEPKAASSRQTARNGSRQSDKPKKLNPANNHMNGDTVPAIAELMDGSRVLDDTLRGAL